jgi:hypothetical protein
MGRPLRRAVPVYERVMRRTRRASDGCLEFTGSRNARGYGQLGSYRPKTGDTRPSLAHRAVWEYHNGPIPEGLVVRHTCDNPACVEIAHLLLGTRADNSADMVARGRGRALKGEENPRCKLTDAEVEEVRTLVAGGATRREVGERFGVHPTHIGRIVGGKRR